MNKKITENEVAYYVWNSEQPLFADVFGTVVFKDGGQIYGKIGQTEIKKGDALSLNYGASRQVYTISGKSYEPEYKYGRVTLLSCPVAVELKAEEFQKIQFQQTSKEVLNDLVKNQVQRIEPIVNQLVEKYIEEESNRRNLLAQEKLKAEEKRKKMIADALTKMEDFFGKKEEPSETAQSTNRAARKLK